MQAAAAAVLQSKALDMVARMQCRITHTHLRKNADLLPASAAETLTQIAAHLVAWCAASRVLCALAAGQDYSPEEDSVVTATLECLAWQLATSIGQGLSSSDAAASSSVGKADSNSSSGRSGGCSSRMLVAESVLAAIDAMCRHTAVGQMDYLQDRNHWWLNVLLVLVDSHLAVQALAAGAATPGAAAVVAAVESGVTGSCAQPPLLLPQQLAARVSSTIQAMLQVMDVTPLALEGLAAARQQQISAGLVDSFGLRIPAMPIGCPHVPPLPAADHLCAFCSSVAALRVDLEALTEMLLQQGAATKAFIPGIRDALQFLRQELQETLPLLLLQVTAAFGARAQQLPAGVLSETAGAVGAFCRVFDGAGWEFADWAAVEFPLAVFGSPGHSGSTGEVFDSLALVLLQCVRPLCAALRNSRSSAVGGGRRFDAGAVANRLHAASQLLDALQAVLAVSLSESAAAALHWHESLISVEVALECVLRSTVQPWLLRHGGVDGVTAAACACFWGVTRCAFTLLDHVVKLFSQESVSGPAAVAAAASLEQLRLQQQQQHHARQVFCCFISWIKTAPMYRFWSGGLQDACLQCMQGSLFAWSMAEYATIAAASEGPVVAIASTGPWLHLAGRCLLQLAQLVAEGIRDTAACVENAGCVVDGVDIECTCTRSRGSSRHRRRARPAGCCKCCASLQDDLAFVAQTAAVVTAMCCIGIMRVCAQAGATGCTCQDTAAAEGQCTHSFVCTHKPAFALVLQSARPPLGGEGAALDQTFELGQQQVQVLVAAAQLHTAGGRPAAGSSTGQEQVCLAGWPAAQLLAIKQLQQVTDAAFDTLSAVTACFYAGSSSGQQQQIACDTLTAALDRSLSVGAAVYGLQQQLVAVGEAWCAACPVPWCCNSPECGSVARVSEAALVGGKACVCGGCGVAR